MLPPLALSAVIGEGAGAGEVVPASSDDGGNVKNELMETGTGNDDEASDVSKGARGGEGEGGGKGGGGAGDGDGKGGGGEGHGMGSISVDESAG